MFKILRYLSVFAIIVVISIAFLSLVPSNNSSSNIFGFNAFLHVSTATVSCPSGTYMTYQASTKDTYCVSFSPAVTTYSKAGLLHVIVTQGDSYVISISCIDSSCGTPTSVIVNGWASGQIFCKGSCVDNGPWSGTVNVPEDACGTAPILIGYGIGPGSAAVILEAVNCTTTTTSSSSSSSSTTSVSSSSSSSSTCGNKCGVVIPQFPIGSILAVLVPLTAVGLYVGARKGFKL